MPRIIDEIKYDAAFIGSHEVQPKWYKFGKMFLLIGVLAGYWALFGWKRTLVFFGVFVACSLVIHTLYRVKTRKYTQSWLDFRIKEVDGVRKPGRIGVPYYLMVATSAAIAVVVSQITG